MVRIRSGTHGAWRKNKGVWGDAGGQALPTLLVVSLVLFVIDQMTSSTLKEASRLNVESRKISGMCSFCVCCIKC